MAGNRNLKPKGPAPEGRPSPRVRIAVRSLLLVALGVDLYLAWVSLSGGSVAGCGPESNCGTVLGSRYAYWLGVPVSLPALGVYGAMLLTSLGLGPSTPPAKQKSAWLILIPCCVTVLAAGLWFIGVQVFLIKTICPFCMTAHASALTASALLLSGAPIRNAPLKLRERDQAIFITTKRALGLGAAGLAMVAVLIFGQSLRQPKTFVSSPITAGVTTNVPAAIPRRMFQIFEGQFQFDLNDVPLIGRPDAPHTMVSLFDYTCHHCREMHHPLMEAQHRFSNELAIISLPMPLDSQCNPLVKRTQAPHTNACALARIGLTVWRANRSAAPAFDEWIFATTAPPLPSAAEKFARDLVGGAAFDQAFTNRWVADQISQDVAIYGAIYRRYRKGFMPEVIIGTNLISGSFTRDQLFGQLADQFGLKQN